MGPSPEENVYVNRNLNLVFKIQKHVLIVFKYNFGKKVQNHPFISMFSLLLEYLKKKQHFVDDQYVSI